jgi:RNA polymerase primary sigma factor
LGLVFNSLAEGTSEPDNNLLGAADVRLIVGGGIDTLCDFAKSPRLHARDLKGDTPLHIAARIGSLIVCDLFIRSGADPQVRNHDGQTPAEVAFAEGHSFAAQLLSLLVVVAPENETLRERGNSIDTQTSLPEFDVVPKHHFTPVQEAGLVDIIDDLDDLLTFEAEVDPEEFFSENTSSRESGTFVALLRSSRVILGDENRNWDIDLSPAPIVGEGIGFGAALVSDHSSGSDFLQVRNRGRRSIKRIVVQTGTQIYIDQDLCSTWVEDILIKRRCSLDDIDRLVAHCQGNGDLEELRINLQRNLEAAGFDLDQATEHEAELWDKISYTSFDDIVDAIEATLSRRTRLPGTQRFVLDKEDELQLLDPMMRAKQELQLGILGSKTAVDTILHAINCIRDGSRDPRSVSLRTVIPSRLGHAETLEVMAAADTLRSWHTAGRVMDGKRRREALAALEALDLSIAFYKELVTTLEQTPTCQTEASLLEAEILVYESTTDHLIREHLPYVRRFASRNVEEGEDPEDVFQVAFMGLQRSTRRFDPERGYRFLIYATYWMQQSISRWRADEGGTIRIPVHRNEKITKFDRALEKLDIWVDGVVSDMKLAEELEWSTDEVKQFRAMPRQAEFVACVDGWDKLLPETFEVDVIEQAEIERIVTGALAELPERQADVIRMRFGIGRDSEMTLEQIGQVYGVTRERIRQIEAKALNHLSHPGRKRRLQGLLGM